MTFSAIRVWPVFRLAAVLATKKCQRHAYINKVNIMQCRHVSVRLPAMDAIRNLQEIAQQCAAAGHKARKSQLSIAILMGAHSRYAQCQ